MLLNKLVIGEHFKSSYGQDYTQEFAVGSTIRVPLPQRWFVTTGLAYQPQSMDRPFTTVVVDQIKGVHFEWNTVEGVLSMERGKERIKEDYLDPAMAQLAQEIDSHCARLAFLYTNNVVGALGTNPANTDFAGAALARLTQNACPPGEKRMVITPGGEQTVVNGSTTIFNPQKDISTQWREGSIGRARNFDWWSSMSLIQHTAGTWAGTVEVTGADQSGSTLNVTCTNGDTFNAGDRFNIAGVFNVNPSTRQSTGVLKDFVILENAVGSGGAAVLTISPAIIGPGSHYQNVNSLPAAGADMTLWPGTASPNGKVGTVGLALHKSAFALVGVKLQNPAPGTVEVIKTVRDPKTGIELSFIRAFDPVERRWICRWDTLYGTGVLYPDNCAVACAMA